MDHAGRSPAPLQAGVEGAGGNAEDRLAHLVHLGRHHLGLARLPAPRPAGGVLARRQPAEPHEALGHLLAEAHPRLDLAHHLPRGDVEDHEARETHPKAQLAFSDILEHHQPPGERQHHEEEYEGVVTIRRYLRPGPPSP